MALETGNLALDYGLDDFLNRGPYVGYCYSYPHKTSYRPLLEQLLNDVWESEIGRPLFLYVHIPFCEFRCGFCNLFTLSQPNAELPQRYLATLQRESQLIAQHVGRPFGQLAIGGGTPTHLSYAQLAQLFGYLDSILAVDGQSIPVSMEVSPATVSPEKLRLMRQFGVDRVSIGVQSFKVQETSSLGRPQTDANVRRAIDWIRAESFPILNLDLIYGADGQTVTTWLESVEQAVALNAEEIYLYPLYVRHLTGLSNIGKQASDSRLELYRAGRIRLLAAGYEQVSMRMFRHQTPTPGHPKNAAAANSVDYRCQEDGMIGLGCGARSYTRSLHYGSAYGVHQSRVAEIIGSYLNQTDEQLATVSHGIELNDDERRRRYAILSLFLVSGLSLADYRTEFGSDALDDLPQMRLLVDRGLAELTTESLTLNNRGIEQSDAIGPWLYSQTVRGRMEEFSWNDA